jgi:hypothetical protein
MHVVGWVQNQDKECYNQGGGLFCGVGWRDPGVGVNSAL